MARDSRLFQTNVQYKYKISDRASVFAQREDREWNYQKKSVAGTLVCKLSGVQSSTQKRSSWGGRSTEKRVCIVFVNQWAASGEMQDEEGYGQFSGTFGIRRAASF